MHSVFRIGGTINTRALCLYLLIVAAWRRAVLCALTKAIENPPVSPENHPDPHNTCADITGRKFYYHKLQMSNVCDARTDILDTSSWDNDSSWIWEQAFFNDFASGMSLTEYEETTARKTGVGPSNAPGVEVCSYGTYKDYVTNGIGTLPSTAGGCVCAFYFFAHGDKNDCIHDYTDANGNPCTVGATKIGEDLNSKAKDGCVCIDNACYGGTGSADAIASGMSGSGPSAKTIYAGGSTGKAFWFWLWFIRFGGSFGKWKWFKYNGGAACPDPKNPPYNPRNPHGKGRDIPEKPRPTMPCIPKERRS